jgi:hypothetical protein
MRAGTAMEAEWTEGRVAEAEAVLTAVAMEVDALAGIWAVAARQ